MFGEPPAPPVALAAGSTRLVGKLIDMTIVLAVTLGFEALLDDGLDSDGPSTTVSLLTLAFVVIYEVGMTASKGGTVGKLALGMRVVDSRGVTPPAVNVALLRWLPNMIAVVPIVGPIAALAVVLASLLWIFTDPAHRSIFDRVGGTFVATVR